MEVQILTYFLSVSVKESLEYIARNGIANKFHIHTTSLSFVAAKLLSEVAVLFTLLAA